MRAAHFFKRQLLASLSLYPPATLKRDLASSFFYALWGCTTGEVTHSWIPEQEAVTSALRARLGIKKDI